MATGIMKILRDKGFDFFLERNKLDKSNDRPRSAADMTSVGTGVITGLREGGFGFIARDGTQERSDLYFHRSAVAGDGFDALRTGQQVTFGEEPDPHDRNRQRAVNVQAAGEVDEEESGAVAPRDRGPSVITDARKMQLQPEMSLRQEQV